MIQKKHITALLLFAVLRFSYQTRANLNSKGKLLKRETQERGFLEKKKKNQVQELYEHMGSNPYFPYKPSTGYIDIYDESNSMFYWLSLSRQNPAKDPLILWMDGGPGGSSVACLFWYLGPFEVKNYPVEDKTAKIREISWNQNANVIFADFPLGVGFSTNTADHVALTGKDIQDQMLRFFEGFFKKHPEFKRRPLYIAGTSYGAHPVAYTAHALKYSGNQNINLKGIFITSGLISGVDMFGSYPEFALLNKQYTKVTQKEYINLTKERDVCVHLLKQGRNGYYQYNGFNTCEAYYGNFLGDTYEKNKNFNTYFMPGHHKDDFSFVNFLNSTGVKDYLGVKKESYGSLNNTFLLHLGRNDFRNNVSPLIGELLDDGVRAVIVDGEDDFICNYQQSEKSITDMKWSGKQGWSNSVRKPCKYGLCKEYLNLKQIRVPGAGHAVPLYKPEFGLEIVNELISKDDDN